MFLLFLPQDPAQTPQLSREARLFVHTETGGDGEIKEKKKNQKKPQKTKAQFYPHKTQSMSKSGNKVLNRS